MNWDTIKTYLKGALRSWTVHFNVWVGALTASLPMLQTSFPQMRPFIPADLYQYAFGAIVFGNILLRVKTNNSLADKVKP
jgi:hypothetical protein